LSETPKRAISDIERKTPEKTTPKKAPKLNIFFLSTLGKFIN